MITILRIKEYRNSIECRPSLSIHCHLFSLVQMAHVFVMLTRESTKLLTKSVALLMLNMKPAVLR